MDTPFVKTFKVDPSLPLHEMLVPTLETLSRSHIMHLLTIIKKPIVLIGGIGKTLELQKLQSELRGSRTSLQLVQSRSVQPALLQDKIEAKLEKKKGKALGAPTGKPLCVSLDNINHAAVDQFGAQPSLEFIRQYFDHGGWYSFADKCFKEIYDVHFIAAVGGSAQELPVRLMRHFQPIYCPEIKDVSVDRIFTAIIDTQFTTNNATVTKLLHIIPRATMAVYRSASNTLLPVSSRIHYIYHIRDVFKILKGVIFGVTQQANINISQLMRLWFHECIRVFGDKLNLKEDKQWLADLLTGTMKTFFEYTSVSLTGDVLFGIMTKNSNYDEIYDVEKFIFNMKMCLNEYNTQNTRKPLDIYLFKEAVISLAKISRVITRPNNNVMVLGKLGVGRLSLTKLSAFIVGLDIFEISISKTYGIQDWQEDIKKLLRLTGLQGKPMLFLVTENQLVHPRFMEDLANIIHSGCIPDLFQEEETESIAQTMQVKWPLPLQDTAFNANTHQATLELYYNKFISHVRSNLRVALSLDPLSYQFKEYVRNYPSMICCCTMVYVDDWTQDSLKAVARHQLSMSSLETSLVDKVTSSLVSLQQIVAQVHSL